MTTRRSRRILLVSTADLGGGAELSAWNLFNAYRNRGYAVQLAVGRKTTTDPDVVRIDNDSHRHQWARFWRRAGDSIQPVGRRLGDGGRLRDLALWTGEPIRWINVARGREDFCYPGTWQLAVGEYDLVHCYNLHGDYFDLRVLPALSRRYPVIVDLRDAWLLSGHCSHSLGCDRWKSGCGRCPDLKLYPSIRRDGTAFNWRRKRRLFSKSRLYAASPSHWMMQKVRESMLGPHVQEMRVIPTGIDLAIFNPGERERSRARLGIPLDAKVLLFVANAIRRNTWKDFQTLATAFQRVRERVGQELVLVGLGEKTSSADAQHGDVRFVPHSRDTAEVASYYQSADVYVHAAAVDTFPRAVLEALACGTAVVGTRVGGIPEQIRDLDEVGPSAATGILVPAADADAFARAIERLLTNDQLRQQLGRNAALDARNRFDLQMQADQYLSWYETLIARTASAVFTRHTEPGPDVLPSSIGLNR
jgi:glycosyltransferase involved in cell wall biosynthesis